MEVFIKKTEREPFFVRKVEFFFISEDIPQYILLETDGLNFASFYIYICIKFQSLTRDFFILELIYE